MTLADYQKQVFVQCKSLKLPPLNDDELAQSYENYRIITNQIKKSALQSISITEFINTALYEPRFGYYTGRKMPFGKSGDFTTAPEIDSGLGVAIAQAISTTLLECDGKIIECGAGTGELAAQILGELNRQRIPWKNYQFLDVSASLKQVQRETLIKHQLYDPEKISWIKGLSDNTTATVIGNEIIDAIPAHFFKLHDGQWLEQRIILDNHNPTLVWQSLQTPEIVEWLKEHFDKVDWQDNVIYEVAPWRSGWMKSMAEHLAQGSMLLVDYGYSAEEFFHPQRRTGTAKAFFRHHSHHSLHYFPGVQDITSHVNFSELCLAAESHGLSLTGYATQADFLIGNGVLEQMDKHRSVSKENADDKMRRLAQSRRLQQLLLPGEMGEVMKVIAFTKNISENAVPRVSSQLISRL